MDVRDAKLCPNAAETQFRLRIMGVMLISTCQAIGEVSLFKKIATAP